MHLQRVGVDESPAERSTDKWIAEGEVNGLTLKYLKRMPTLQAENVMAFLLKWIEISVN